MVLVEAFVYEEIKMNVKTKMKQTALLTAFKWAGCVNLAANTTQQKIKMGLSCFSHTRSVVQDGALVVLFCCETQGSYKYSTCSCCPFILRQTTRGKKAVKSRVYVLCLDLLKQSCDIREQVSEREEERVRKEKWVIKTAR